jgi:hypothetical protein
MPNDGVWIFVDDLKDEASAFAEELAASGKVQVVVMGPDEARTALLQQGREPAGVLMDVDLSSIAGEFGTGPGIAQDIRTKQKAKSAREFPIVRFSAAEPLAKNVIGDPSSDDLFELKILKNDVKLRRDEVVAHLLGLREIYDSIINIHERPEESAKLVPKLFALDEATLAVWGHEGLNAKILTGVRYAPHVAAGVFCRQFIMPYGLLLDERLLAVRLGVDVAASGNAWGSVLKLLEPIRYLGVAGEHIVRWWARGLEDWWFKNIDQAAPLAGIAAVKRVALLTEVTKIAGLAALSSPPGSSNGRFWRFCRLGLESTPAEYIPVDPSESIRLVSQVDSPAWIEPLSASIRLALRARDDTRLNTKDLDRFRKKLKV